MKFEGVLNPNSRIINIQIFAWSGKPDILGIIFLYKIYLKTILLLKLENVNENVNKTNEKDIIATIEVIEKKFEKLCSLNSKIEELAEDAENNKEIYDGCLQSEVNITKKIHSLKSLVNKEKGLIKNSDSNLLI